MIEIEEVEKWGQLCSICGKPVRYWHDQLSESDEFVSTSWHKRCAKDYETWLYKMTHILPNNQEIPISKHIRWEDYQRRILNIGDKLCQNKE